VADGVASLGRGQRSGISVPEYKRKKGKRKQRGPKNEERFSPKRWKINSMMRNRAWGISRTNSSIGEDRKEKRMFVEAS